MLPNSLIKVQNYCSCRFVGGVGFEDLVRGSAGFRPGRRACCLARPEGRNYRLVRLEERNLCVEEKAPKPLTPRLASIGADGRQPAEGGPTRSAHTRPAS